MTDVAKAEVGVFRAFTERLLGSLVLTRRLPKRFGGGRLIISGKVGGMKYLFKRADAWDPELMRIASLLVKKNDVVWDVGANVGLFTKCASYFAAAHGQVYSIEADTDALVLLNRTISNCSSEDAPITLLSVAVSDHTGWEIFSISRRARASNSLAGYGSSSTGGILQNRVLPAVSLDRMLDKFPPPNVLKIDVEGAEVKVLKGGEKVLSTVRPLIYCEIARENVLELKSVFTKFDYRYLDGREFLSIESMDGKGNKIGFNTVAVPEEKIPELGDVHRKVAFEK